MNITVNDLDSSLSLDQKAMTGLLGGGSWHTHSSSTSVIGASSTGWSAWASTGIPFTKKRTRHSYRTIKTVKRQHKYDVQYKASFSIGF